MNSRAETQQLLQDAVEALGYEFVGCEFISSQGNTLIRVYIDKVNSGVTISDCVAATHQIRGVLEVAHNSQEEEFTPVNEEADERWQRRHKKKDSTLNIRSIFSYDQATREEATQFTPVNEEADERRQRRHKKKDIGYTLEVSSPGLERPLFHLNHFIRFEGKKARIQLKQLQEQRRDITGTIRKVEGGIIHIEENDKIYEIKHTDIKKANLVE